MSYLILEPFKNHNNAAYFAAYPFLELTTPIAPRECSCLIYVEEHQGDVYASRL